jgi:hypothetical protein
MPRGKKGSSDGMNVAVNNRRGHVGMALEQIVTLSWTIIYRFGSSTEPTYAQICLNSAYDPWFPISSTPSANEFANLAALYEYYEVTSFDINCLLNNAQGQATTFFFLVSSNDPIGYSFIDALELARREKKFGKGGMLGQGAGPSKDTYVKHDIKVKEVVGQREIIQEEDLYAPVTASPARPILLTIGVQSDTATAVAVTSIITINMHCRFFEKRAIANPGASLAFLKHCAESQWHHMESTGKTKNLKVEVGGYRRLPVPEVESEEDKAVRKSRDHVRSTNLVEIYARLALVNSETFVAEWFDLEQSSPPLSEVATATKTLVESAIPSKGLGNIGLSLLEFDQTLNKFRAEYSVLGGVSLDTISVIVLYVKRNMRKQFMSQFFLSYLVKVEGVTVVSSNDY